jgi:hypothetical protein
MLTISMFFLESIAPDFLSADDGVGFERTTENFSSLSTGLSFSSGISRILTLIVF